MLIFSRELFERIIYNINVSKRCYVLKLSQQFKLTTYSHHQYHNIKLI